MVHAVADAGADAVEIGIPFSDPVMDGVTIQEASRRALEQGATPAGIIAEAGADDVEVPLAVMTYTNPVGHMGFRRFAAALAGAGIAGGDRARPPARRARRLGRRGRRRRRGDRAARRAHHPRRPSARHLRAVPRLRLRRRAHGRHRRARPRWRRAAREMGERCKAVTDKPVLLGVGISTPEQAVEASSYADGVIVGSALVVAPAGGRWPRRRARVRRELRVALDESTRVPT